MNEQQVRDKFNKYLEMRDFEPAPGYKYPCISKWMGKRRAAYAYYGPLFNTEKIDDLRHLRATFREWLVFGKNQSWTNLPRAGYRALIYLNPLYTALKTMQDEKITIEKRYDLCLHGPNKVPFIGPGILTGFLHTIYPNKYAVLNGSTSITLNIITGGSALVSSYDSGIKYSGVNTWCKNLAESLNADLTTFDGFLWALATGKV